MIRRDQGSRADLISKLERQDGPSLAVPSTHLNLSSDAGVLSFMGIAVGRLTDRNSSHKEVGQTIREIYAVLHLRRQQTSPIDWRKCIDAVRAHEITQVLHQDAFTRHAFDKPRGYAGDAGLLDHMYATEHFWDSPKMSWVGERIYRWTTLCSACQGVKARREIIADLIDDLARTTSGASVLSLAAGHMREAEFSKAIIRKKLSRMLAIDSDASSLEQIERDYGCFGVSTLAASARQIISGRMEIGEFDLIYTSGLCDYLNESMCERLALNLFMKLNPGGKLMLTNFVDNVEAVGYMETFMDWNLIYRDRIDMMKMTNRIPDRLIRNVECYSEENHNVLFIVIERADA